MTYKQKFYKEIFLKALQDALLQGLISHQEEFEKYITNKQDISNFYVMILSVHSEIFEQVYADMTDVYLSDKIDYATGEDLDNLGRIVGVTRPPATHASTEITFALSRSQDTDVQEHAGLIVSSKNNGISYRTVEELFIAAGETAATISALSVSPGTGTAVVENQLTKLQSEIVSAESSVNVTNTKSSTGGYDAFTDDEYRELIKHWTEIYEKGNEWAFRNYLADVDGIDGYRFVPNWDGSGTLKVIIDPGTDYQLNSIYEDMQKLVSQASEDIYMTAPIKVPIDVYASVDVDIDQVTPYSSSKKEEIKAKIISAIRLFIDGGIDNVTGKYYKGLAIGEDFIPYKLGAFLNTQIPELMNITFKIPDNYIQISDEEIGTANTITIEMM